MCRTESLRREACSRLGRPFRKPRQIGGLGFRDGTVSLDWIESAGCRVVNLLCKGSYKHVTEQLRKTPEQHVDDIRTVVLEAERRKIDVNIYLEDWSNGIKHSPDYVFLVIDALKGLPICRFMLRIPWAS